jgi:hypothetical protein
VCVCVSEIVSGWMSDLQRGVDGRVEGIDEGQRGAQRGGGGAARRVGVPAAHACPAVSKAVSRARKLK